MVKGEVLKNYINGEWVRSIGGKTKRVIDPSTGKAFAAATDSTIADVDAAVAAARESFDKTREWRDLSAEARGEVLLKIADLMEEHVDQLAEDEMIDSGKPAESAEGMVSHCAFYFRYYAGIIGMPQGAIADNGLQGDRPLSLVVREPIGVCALIAPWNFPLLMLAWKMAPALAAGNSIIFKPSSITPVATVTMFEIFEEAGVPKGVVNLVLGNGTKIGDALASHMDVDMVSFTGSTIAGKSVVKAAASSNLKKVGLELGGKSPIIVFDDVDIDDTIDWIMGSIFGGNAGQVCSAGSRLVIDKKIKAAFLRRLISRAKKLVVGPAEINPDIGPLISETQMKRVLGYIEKGKEEGAKLVLGGYRLTEDVPPGGYFIVPTIFDDTKPDMTIVQEEIFGPVLVVQTFTTESEAIELANNTSYGLAGAVFSKDSSRGIRVISEVRAGITFVNSYGASSGGTPWGGYKMSGWGRELGPYGLDEYQETKQISFNIEPAKD